MFLSCIVERSVTVFIKQLHAISYKGLRNLEVNFYRAETVHPLKVSVMVGDNGVGKSSLLQLLADIFCPVQRSIDQKPEFRYEISFQMNTYEEKDIDFPVRHTLHYTHDSGLESMYPSKLIVSSHSAFDPYQITSRLVGPRFEWRHFEAPSLVSPPRESAYVYCGPNERNFSSLEAAINAVLKTHLSSEERVWKGYDKLFKKIGYGKLIYLEVDFHRIKRVKESIETFRDKGRITNELFERLEFYLNEFRDLRRKCKRSPSHRIFHLVPLESINPIFIETMLQLSSLDAPRIIRDLWFLSPDGSAEVPLSDFSSGELTMIYRFLPLVLEIESNSIILIDEPETHLHPRWAQEFIEYLIDLFGSFEAHIIVATHSPIIISDVPTESLVILEKRDGVIAQRMPKDRTFGATSTDIMKDVFFMTQMSGNQSAAVIKRIEQQLNSGDQSQINEARRLFQMLSTTFEKFELYQKYRKQIGD